MSGAAAVVIGLWAATTHCRQDATQNFDWGRWTAGYGKIDRDDVRHAAAARIAFAEDSAIAAALAHRDYQLGIGSRVKSTFQGHCHVPRNRSGHEQHVGMARTRNEPDAEPFDVVVGIVQGVDFQFAAIARTRIDLPDRERATEYVKDVALNALRFEPHRIAGFGRGFGAYPGAHDLFDDGPHQRSCPE